ncbi:hypothetical protein N9O56_01745 [Rickettsiales bacterium]|nr:hypothetical protein [Rickettsiales bacterium]
MGVRADPENIKITNAEDKIFTRKPLVNRANNSDITPNIKDIIAITKMHAKCSLNINFLIPALYSGLSFFTILFNNSSIIFTSYFKPILKTGFNINHRDLEKLTKIYQKNFCNQGVN